MQNPLISILIPFKNTAIFLSECLNSIKDQTYTNWEVIAIDDRSTDNSLQLVQDFARNDQRIRVFKNSGVGIIEALRLAYDKSQGDFITRMDSDDHMALEKLLVLARGLQTYGRGHLAVGQVHYFSERGISNGYARYEKWLNELTATGTNYAEIYKECVIPSPCWMAYRTDLDLCGAFEPNRYPEDYDLTFRFYEKGLKCIPCNTILHHWRDYDTRTSRTSEHYAQNYFLDIKLHYFLKLDREISRPLVIWGAGNKGKAIAKGLQNAQIDFVWLCDNPNKIGKSIYDQDLQHYSLLEQIEHPQSIITVANTTAQKEIGDYLRQLEQKPMTDYFFFC